MDRSSIIHRYERDTTAKLGIAQAATLIAGVHPLRDQTSKTLALLVRVARHIARLGEAADAILIQRRGAWARAYLRRMDEKRWGLVRQISLTLRAMPTVERADRLANEELQAAVKAAQRASIALR